MRRRRKKSNPALPLLAAGGAVLTAAELARRVYRHTQLFCPSPDPVKSWDPKDYGIPDGAVEEHWFETPDGELLYGWYCRAKKPVASALFCHGNTGNLTVSADVIPHLLSAGINVLFFDYRGFGRSSGFASVNGVVADGITAAQFHHKIRPKKLPSILYGFSLGGGVAAQVIKRHPFDGLILQSTFTSLPDVTRALFPRLPLHLFAGKLFDTLSVIKRLTVPLLVVHGSDDEVIPCWMAHALHDHCGAEKKSIQIVDGGLHKDLYLRDCETLVWAINRFATDLPRNTRHIPLERATRAEEWIDGAFRFLRRAVRRKVAPQSV
ncbi:MAG TPA: alpha/beta fold hydrolase [Thermoanaerobaculia bacterium]|nr:alpha/beta fold hydrolase [Thermoanaerobaculia bacterium]